MFGFGDKKPVSEWHQATQTQEKTDWTHFLSPDATQILRNILTNAYKNREAYFKADDIKNAQLWSALVEMQREIDELRGKVTDLTPKDKIVHKEFALGTSDDSVVLDKVRAIMQPQIEDTKEATDALVDSLMKF